MLRLARREDFADMHRVRLAVRENRLTSSVITEADYIHAIEETGRGWVIEDAGAIVAFAVGNALTGNIWALFVDPAYERRGYGRILHDAMVSWLWSRGCARLWLATEPGTRAQRFYAAAGWRATGSTPHGEVAFELARPAELRERDAPAIGFRRLDIDDLQQVFLWLIRPHVSKWYAPAPTSFAEVVAKYGPRTQQGNAVRAYVIEVDGSPAGYIQGYDLAIFPEYAASIGCERGVAGIDLFIGEEALLNRGLGAAAVRRFVDEHVFAAGDVHACVAGPDEGHRASIRAFEKAGFRRWRTLRIDDGRRECVLRRERDARACHLAPIDLARDLGACVRFRRESYVASFGSETGLEEEMGAGNALYIAKLRGRIAEVPEGNAHLWREGRIVGQTEMRLSTDDPRIGYVNLFYVVPELRGQGLGRTLHEHAAGVFRARGKQAMRLSVSEQNAAAIAFYTRLGWARVGTREHHATMQVMEFPLA